MPFHTATEFPTRNPDVQIFFHGLLMLCPAPDGSECRVGVHRLAINHRLSVSVRERTAEAPDPPLLRLGGTLDSMGLTISVDPPTGSGVSQFVPDSDPFDRTAEHDAKDFRWSVDLETLDPAQPPMILKQSGISPSVTVKDGLFHTARLTDPAILQVSITDPPNLPTQLHKVARLIGANIYLEDGQTVVLEWFGDGERQKLTLPGSDGVRPYVIYIDNSPALMPTEVTHDEFKEYYNVVTNASKEFKLKFKEIGTVNSGTDRAPCMSVVVGKGGALKPKP